MSRIAKAILLFNLAALTVLAFAYPHLMVAPGKLIDGHRAYAADCFACHSPLFGASSAKCAACHKAADIGVRTTKGLPVSVAKAKVPFHQKLVERDCVACHSDHQGVIKYRARQKFTHGLLDAATQRQCAACHPRPAGELHRRVSDQCVQCHVAERWKPATFKHDMLPQAERNQCVFCHKAKVPADALHRQAPDNCGLCHGTDRWKPATFDHARYFRFDRDHDVKCTVCHTTPDYKQYTCYGCHEHRPDKVRREHLEEGIRDFQNCVLCHRSADEDEAERAWKAIRRGVPFQFDAPGGRTDRPRREKDDDD